MNIKIFPLLVFQTVAVMAVSSRAYAVCIKWGGDIQAGETSSGFASIIQGDGGALIMMASLYACFGALLLCLWKRKFKGFPLVAVCSTMALFILIFTLRMSGSC